MRQKFINLITLKGFSKNTINNYLSIFDLIIKDDDFIFEKSEDEIIAYLSSKIIIKKCSQSYISQHISVFSIVLNEILKRPDNIKLPRIKRKEKQPDILSKYEMSKLLAEISNVKHKTIVALMYSTGLRVSEACGLKVADIDSENNCISVRKAKGGNDRKVMLDSSILKLLREYYEIYRPNIYLFNGATGNEYSSRSVQQIITNAAKKAGIKKRISSHSMRHSCFTQLIKEGVDIRHIQRLAGHKNISTTARYLQITEQDVLNIKSPIRGVSI